VAFNYLVVVNNQQFNFSIWSKDIQLLNTYLLGLSSKLATSKDALSITSLGKLAKYISVVLVLEWPIPSLITSNESPAYLLIVAQE